MNRIATVFVATIAGIGFAAGCQRNADIAAADSKPAAAAAVAATEKTSFVSYGEPVKPGETVAVKTVLADVSKFEGKPVRIEGTVSKVCERKGCWMQMADGEKALFVKFTCPVDGRLIPMDAVGKRAVAQGQLVVKEISEDDARHIAEEAGKSQAEVAKIVGPQKQVTLASPGAVVYGVN